MGFPVNIEDLVNRRIVESVRIEFKEGWQPEEVVRTVCAFANDINEYGGGYLVIGVKEVDGTPVLPPTGLNLNQLDPIQKKFFELCKKISPNIFPIIEPAELEGKHIIVIWVTTGEERPYKAPSSLGRWRDYKIYVRPASLTVEASPIQEKRIREIAQIKHFDDRINNQVSIDDLDLGLIQSYLQEIKSTLYDETFKIPLEDICLKMQIARGPQENLRPLNVGILLFHKEPEKIYPGCVTNLVVFEDQAGKVSNSIQFKGPLHIQIKQILDYFKTNIITKYSDKTRQSVGTFTFDNYPFLAIKEAIANAFHHRNYEIENPNEIRIFKSGTDLSNLDARRIEIISYPGPLPPVDENALLQLDIKARNYRNIRLGDWLKNLGLVEKLATGIPTIVTALQENGSPLPILSTDQDKHYFLVVLKIHPDTPESSKTSVAEFKIIPLSDQQQKILEWMLNEPKTIRELSENYKDNNIEGDVEYLLTHELLSQKDIKSEKIYFVTDRGRTALKSSF